MAKYFISIFSSSFLFLLLSLTPNEATSSQTNTISSYIIHTENLTRPSQYSTQSHWYSSIIKSAINSTTSDDQDARIFYTYNTVLHGFAAMLTPQEVERVSKTEGVIGVYNDSIIHLHTTRSPDFLGLNLGDNFWTESNFSGEDVIIGLVDSGIWPESHSFDDTGFSPVPYQWQGECVSGVQFNSSLCNKKLIGARFFASGMKASGSNISDLFLSPRDDYGHGTHTSSTAAGFTVPDAGLFGFANGTARGMAMKARLAMYKACWGDFGCTYTDVTAAMDAAIKDGVNILSLSLGANNMEYDVDPIAIGAFAAVRNGIFVACSAGNDGPDESTVSNTAPWITTVGAGSIDRKFPARITLGNSEVFVGESLFEDRKSNLSRMLPLVHLSICNVFDGKVAQTIKGKIVVCDYASAYTGIKVAEAGGAGLVVLNNQYSGEGIMVQAFTLPALTLGYSDSKKLVSYINSTSNPRAMLEFNYQTVIGETRAPTVAFFSSRGPNDVLPEILKPDMIAPGLNILASWPTMLPVTENSNDTRRSAFNVLSGTSMACPHVAGIAALLRAVHPQWSPAMIRSAMMTTAFDLDNTYRQIILDENLDVATPLAMGAGHVHPVMANEPGLVYDASFQDYIDLLCTMNYNETRIRKLVPGPFSCSKFEGGAADLNYPSFVVIFDDKISVRMLKRTLTKVTELPETYEARVVNPSPDKVEVIVEPKRLEFRGANEKLSYTVEFRSKADQSGGKMEHGYIIWENKEHQVKSPVVLLWK